MQIPIEYILSFILLAIPMNISSSISVWNKNMFFSHHFAHTLLLPPAICIFFNITSDSSILIFSIIFGILFAIFFMSLNKFLKLDQNFTLLIASLIFFGISTLLSQKGDYELNGYMFGDLAFINNLQMLGLGIISICYILLITKYYKPIVIHSINSDLGKIANKNIDRIIGTHIVMQCIVVVIASRMFGTFIISTTMIIAPVLMRIVSKSPIQMIVMSSVMSSVMSILGLKIANIYNLHYSAMIVILYGLTAIIILLGKFIQRKLHI